MVNFSIRNINDLNYLYNFLDTKILCKIFDSRASLMNEKYKFNLRRCNAASTLSGCIQINQSKVIILLPTHTETIDLFEKKLIRGFSSVSTHPAFNTNVLMPNLGNNSETIKREDLKVKYNLKNEKKTNRYKDKRIVSKILKMDENNQNGNAMTKPMPLDIIKKQKICPDLQKFNFIIETISPDNKIGQLFIVDIKFAI